MCHQDPSWSYSQTVIKPLWHIPWLCVQWKTPDDGQGDCPKHVELYSKNKFEKLVHLVGLIIRTFHDALSSEHQICKLKIYIRLIHSSNFGTAKDWNTQTRIINRHLLIVHGKKNTFILCLCWAATVMGHIADLKAVEVRKTFHPCQDYNHYSSAFPPLD